MSSTLENFHKSYLARDHAEANLINEAYDILATAGVEDPLKSAIDAVEFDLSDKESTLYKENPDLQLPNVEDFGYEQVKKAYRWWNYRNAYIRDLPVGPADMERLHSEQADSGAYLHAGNALFIAAFAQLDEERLFMESTIADALAYEKELFYESLINTFDKMLEDESSRTVTPAVTAQTAGQLYNQEIYINYQLWRSVIPGFSKEYVLRLTKAGEYNETDNTLLGLRLKKEDDKISVLGHTQEGYLSLSIIESAQLSAMLLPGQEFNKIRRTRP
jgi:hypothetical protein